MRESKCLSCAKFWKNSNNENEKCFKGGSCGGLIRYCSGYVSTEKLSPPKTDNNYFKDIINMRSEFRRESIGLLQKRIQNTIKEADNGT